MPPESPFEGSADDTRTAIMKATYAALAKYGYAGLSIQRIADEFDKSKSAIYHHHDGKDDLLVDFLSFTLDRYGDELSRSGEGTPEQRLRTLFDHALADDLDVDAQLLGIVVELRAQAVHDPRYAELFARSDRRLRSRIADVVQAGVEAGTFREVDPDRTAAFLLALLNGAVTERATTDDPEALQNVRTELDAYVRERLLAK